MQHWRMLLAMCFIAWHRINANMFVPLVTACCFPLLITRGSQCTWGGIWIRDRPQGKQSFLYNQKYWKLNLGLIVWIFLKNYCFVYSSENHEILHSLEGVSQISRMKWVKLSGFLGKKGLRRAFSVPWGEGEPWFHSCLTPTHSHSRWKWYELATYRYVAWRLEVMELKYPFVLSWNTPNFLSV